MTKPKRTGRQCQACEGRGFHWGGRPGPQGLFHVIERCDTCRRFDSDQAAARAIVVVASPDYWSWGVVRDPDQRRTITVVIERG